MNSNELKYRARKRRVNQKIEEVIIGRKGFCILCWESAETEYNHPFGKDVPIVMAICKRDHKKMTLFQNQLPPELRKNNSNTIARTIFHLRSSAYSRLFEAKREIELAEQLEMEELWK